MIRRRPSALNRVVALLLTWAVPGSSAWALTPPAPNASPSPNVVEARSSASESALSNHDAEAPGIDPSAVSPVSEVDPAPGASAPLHPPVHEGDPAPEAPLPAATPAPGCSRTVFPAERFTRTTGPATVYDRSFNVPSWIVSPYALRVQNGEPNGTQRVSSAEVFVGGARVLQQSDFNQTVAAFERAVPLSPGVNTLRVRLTSKPGSYLTIGVCGTNGDNVAPSITVPAPAQGSFINHPTPLVIARYSDGLSGIDAASFSAQIDDVDRISLFVTRSDEASATSPSLSEGPHTVIASVADVAGNTSSATTTFTVDLTPPVLSFAAPAEGAAHPQPSVGVTLNLADALSGIDPSTLRIRVNGIDRTTLFAMSVGEATATLGSAVLVNGANQILATVRDVATNEASATLAFAIDTTAPVLAIGQPVDGARLGSSSTPLIVQFSDDQALSLSTFTATLDGAALPMTVTPESATALVTLAEGAHTFATSIADRAGNITTREITFTVDTQVPSVVIDQPAPSFLLPTATPFVALTYSDAQGVDIAILRVIIDGVDRTAAFSIGPEGATATLSAVPEGEHTISAEIRDLTGNRGTTTASFTTDTLAPLVTISAPGAGSRLRTATPEMRFGYQDGAGSGVEPASIRVLLDGIDLTAAFVLGGTEGVGAPPLPLSDGNHTLRVEVGDRALNIGSAEITFLVDTLAPKAVVEAPTDGSFTNDETPELRISIADLGRDVFGAIAPPSGVDASSVRVFLRSGGPDAPEVDLTAVLAIDATSVSGAIPGPLPAGTHRLRVSLSDRAGNTFETFAAFEVDVTPPTFRIVTIAPGAGVPTATPSFEIEYADDRSGVDAARFTLRVDAADRTALINAGPASAVGTLVLDAALADGPHAYEFTLFDRAGNRTDGGPLSFVVDTVAPTATLAEPAPDSFIGTNTPRVRFAFADTPPSAGIDAASTRVHVDGVDRTAEFTITPDGAFIAALAPALGDGVHTVRADIVDFAGHAESVVGQFTVDTTPPVVTPAGPESGSTIGASLTNGDGTFTLTFSFVDIDPSTTATCSSGAFSVTASPQGGGYSCILPILEGLNTFTVTVTDSTGHASTLTTALTLDTLVPGVTISTPLAASVTSAQTTTVQGTVADATAVSVSVNGVPATVVPGLNGSPTTFEAQGVAVGPGPSATFEAVAQDLGGNIGRASVSIIVDRVLPLVTIATPTSGAYLPGVPATVNVDVIDATVTTLEVNGVVATRGACQPAATAQELSRQRCSYEASVPVTPGAFQIVATARDAASNQGAAQVSVIVDATAPVLTVTAPAAGLVTSANSITVTGTVDDTSPATLTTDGAPTALATGGAFSADIPAGPEGLRTIQLLARDAAGNETARSISVIVDRTAPVLAIGQPTNAARLGSATTPVIVQFADDQLDPATFVATLDGAPFTMTLAEGSATGLAENLAEGPHTVSARIADKAGNVTAREITFTVDTIVPSITIEQPAPSFLMPTATPFVSILYSDAQGVDTSTLRVRVDGIDLTSRFTIASGSATATLLPLSEGAHTIVAEIKDLTLNLASASASFSTDTVAPVVAIVAPLAGARLNTSTPQISFTYQDPGGAASSGVDPSTIRVLLDGVDITAAFVLSGGDATGTAPALTDGSHTLRVEAKDRAANSSFAETTFLVDTQAPVATFGTPLDGSFTNDTTPDVLITFADPGASASGISLSFVRVFLTAVPQGEAGALSAGSPEVDVTSALVVGAATIAGALPGPLAAGTYRVRVTPRDEALNSSEAATTFEVDLTPPTFEIVQPAAGSAILTGSPAFVIRYADDRSGLATDRFAFRVNGVDRTARLTVGASEASGTLSAEEALADGPHSYDFTLFDRAGNRTDSGSISFVVDSAPPTAVLVEPVPQSFIGVNTPRVRFQFLDPAPSSGINTAATRIQVDGVDRTPDFTITADGALVAALSGALSDGLHTVRADIADRSGSAGFVVAQFTVDTTAPVLTSEIPEEGRLVGGGALVDGRAAVSGTATDIDPALTVTCSSPAGAGVATFSNGSYSCSVPVAEGANEISITATDTTAHSATITRTLTVDRIAPTIQITDPTEGTFTSAQSLMVTGTVSDASSAAGLTVSVNGQAAAVTAPSGGGPATFEATNVSVGAGPTAVLEVVATDAAGNAATATVTVRVDRDPPVVAITQPASGDYLRGGVTTVTVDVTDDTATILDINGIPGAQTGCVDTTAETKRCSFTADVPLIAGATTIVATAFDAAGNRGVNQVSTTVDNTPPAISVTSPGLGLITNAMSVAVVGAINDDSPVTLRVNGQAVTVAPGGSFSATVSNDVLGAPLSGIEGARDIVFVATDAAGNEATASVSVVFDRTPPALSIASPLQGAIIPSSSVAVSGTVADATAVTITVEGSPATVIGQAWSTTLAGLVEGALTITVRAVDAAGNESTVVREVEVDLGPPTVAITSPAAGTLTREATALLSFSVLDRSATSITLNGAPVASACPGVAQGQAGALLACERTQTVELGDGDNTFTVEATDAGGRTASAQVTITRDSNAPSVELLAPETASRGRVATASVSAVDNLALASVEVRVAGPVGSTVLCTGVAACSGPIVIPEEARPGDSLTLTATATDTAGNTTTTSRTVRVTSDGVVTGTVLNDLTSLPLAGATVTLLGPNTRSTTTNEQGRYNIPVAEISAILRIEKAGMTSVDRVVSVNSGTGTVLVDARLTPLAESTSHSPVIPATNPPAVIPSASPADVAGTPGPVSLAAEGAQRVTLLSAQGLPNLLPPGFSPLTAFHWMPENASASARVTVALPIGTASLPETVLVRYDTTMRDWRVVAFGLTVTDGSTGVDLVGPGSYALVAQDNITPPITIPGVGEPLAGIAIATIPATATSEGRVDPPVLPPTGGTATGLLRIDSPTPLPSGTIVQADLEETYTLSSGEEASAPKRSVDVITFKHSTLATAWGTGDNAGTITGATDSTVCAPSTPPVAGSDPVEHLCAAFPITPSRTYSNASLREGRVKLDLLAGRENARGVVGGSVAMSVVAGNVQLNVAAGSLAEDTAIALWSYEDYSPFIPTTNGITPLGEVTVDFASSTLNTSAALTFRNVAAAPGDTLVVARVDRAGYDGIPRLQVVAVADVISANNETNAITRVETGLPGVTLEGVKKEGRYTLLRLAGPIGWITGTTTASGSPVRALVTADSLPFVATSNTSGIYAIAAIPGPVTLTARVLGQSLIGGAQTTAVEGAPATVNLLLEGAVSQATITPASGAIGVEVNDLLTLTSPVALDPATVNATNITLRTLPTPPATGSTTVPLRFVLSGSGKHLSIIPTGPITTPPTPALAFSTTYALEITGLLDTVGGLVTAPTTTFRTKDDIKPVYNLKALTFSFPDAEGLVTVSAPAGTLPPGTEILIINSGNGVVLGLTAGNDGEVNGMLPASTSDRLLISVTDPFGNTTTYQQSQFINPATGETAIGPAGGIVEGPGGTGLEVPDGALTSGATFKLTHLSAADLEQQFPGQRPNLGTDTEGNPIGHLAGGIRVDVTGQQVFDREIDLLFPIPADAPEDARYQVYRRLQGPNGRYLFEVLDTATIGCPLDKPTCDESEKRVRTNSCPFPGFSNSYIAFDVEQQPVLGSGNDIFLSWHTRFDNGGDKTGVITGRVIQPISDSAGTRFEGIGGAFVSGVDAAGNPFYEDQGVQGRTVAISQLWQAGHPERGRYTLFDPNFAGGAVTMAAIKGDKSGTGTGFEIPVATCALPSFTSKVQVNITFPPDPPKTAPPQIGIEIRRKDDNSLVNGLVPERTPLVVRFVTPATVATTQINGIEYSVEVETAGTSAKINGDFTPPQPGAYTIEVTGLWPETGGVVSASRTLRAVAAGGGVDTLHGVEPRVAYVGPTAGGTGVPTSAFVEVEFTEPVRRIIDAATPYVNVRIEELDANGNSIGPIPITVSAVTAEPVTVIADLLNGSQAVTALTLIPQTPLRYNTTYRVTLLGGIEDLDETPEGDPSPRNLEEFSWTFETFGPSEIGDSGDETGSPNIAAAGGRVFLARTYHFRSGDIVSFTTDPGKPEIVGASAVYAPRPYDIAAQGDENQRTVAVGVGSTYQSKPSSILIYDATNDADIKLVGAASLTQSAQEGFIRRIAIKGGFAYSATMKKGIQVVDIEQAKAAVASTPSHQVAAKLNTDGQGVGGEAVVMTIEIPPISPAAPDRHYLLYDMAVEDLGGRRLAAVTGQFPLMIADVNTGQRLFPQSFPGTLANASVTFGYAVALGRVANRDVAVLVDEDQLHAVDLTNPASPQVLGSVGYANVASGYGPVSVLLKGDQALIGLQKPDGSSGITIVIGLEDPAAPRIAGHILQVGGRLALTADGLLVSSASLPFGGSAKLGGVHTATLGQLAVIMPVPPTMARPFDLALLTGDDQTVEPVQLDIRTFPKQPQSPVTLQLFANSTPLGAPMQYPVPSTGRVVVDFPAGLSKDMAKTLKAQASFMQDGVLFQSTLRLIPFNTPVLTVDSNNDTFVDKRDDEKIKTDPTAKFVFWEGDTRLEPQDAIVDYATVRVTLPYAPSPKWKVGLTQANGESAAPWEVKRKVADQSVCEGDLPEQGQQQAETGKAYLCSPSAFEAQRAMLAAEEQATRLLDGSPLIPQAWLKAGANEFLVRCNAKTDGSRACGGERLYLFAVPSDPAGSPFSQEVLASRPIEIQPFEKLTATTTLRQGTIPSSDPTSSIYRVDSQHNDEPGWLSALDDVPADADQVTLFVHGYNVTHEQFTKTYQYVDCGANPLTHPCPDPDNHRRSAPSWFSQWAKRSYWAGNPTLPAQKALTIGVSWPGDIPGSHDPGLYFAEDEFNAFQAGLPFGRLVRSLRTRQGVGTRVAIFAHSMGNTVVNNGLKEVPATGAVVNYVMNDAAIATEAFEADFDANNEEEPSPLLVPALLGHARDLGFAAPGAGEIDRVWPEQEEQMGASATACVADPAALGCTLALAAGDLYLTQRAAVAPGFNATLDASSDPLRTPFFQKRWQKWTRPGDAIRPTAWARFFNQNVNAEGVRIFNTYNSNDSLFVTDRGTGIGEGGRPFANAHGWLVAQLKAKPYDKVWVSSFATAASLIPQLQINGSDPPHKQKWWTLELESRANAWASTASAEAAQEIIWRGESPRQAFDGENPTTRGRTRQWAELAMWFPAVSKPVGGNRSPVLEQSAIVGPAFARLQFGPDEINGRNVSLTRIGGTGGVEAVGTASHSYLYMSTLADVWKGYKALAAMWAQP